MSEPLGLIDLGLIDFLASFSQHWHFLIRGHNKYRYVVFHKGLKATGQTAHVEHRLYSSDIHVCLCNKI